MSIEPEFRVLIAYLLVMRWGVALYYRRSEAVFARDPLSETAQRSHILRRIAWLGVAVPLVACAVAPERMAFLEMDFPNVFRWLAVAPAVASIVLVIGSLERASGPNEYFDFGPGLQDGYSEQFHSRSYLGFRHPVEWGDSLLVLSLATMSNHGLASLLAVVFALIMRWTVSSRPDTKTASPWQNEDARRVPQYIAQRRPWPSIRVAEYHVPTRFGLAAIIGLLTVLSLLFGGLNLLRFYLDVPPAVYLFAAGQVVVICIAQMLFHSAPRAVSIMAGAVLLPLFILFTVDFPRWISLALLIVCAGLLGSLLGYCTGALAAGFFLIMDRIEPHLPGSHARRTALAPPARIEDRESKIENRG